MKKRYFYGNWKMNMLNEEAVSFFEEFRRQGALQALDRVEIGIAPPFTTIQVCMELAPHGVLVGAQNAHWLDKGAHTGEVSPRMLVELGAEFAIVGHSERRQFYGETNASVAARARAVLDAGLRAVVCVGETREEFEAKQTKNVVKTQLLESLSGIEADDCQRLIVAYEPVWAIGTGLAATPQIAADVHRYVRELLVEKFGDAGREVPLLYGGSTTPENVAELVAETEINGALIGGASLKPDVFSQLIKNGVSA